MSTYNFPPTSRYHGISVVSLTRPDDEDIAYLRRRFLPLPGRFTVLHGHVVTGGERMDVIAGRELGDPEAFWRICDANGAVRVDDLAVVGRTLRITLPEGIPGATIG